MIFPLKINFRDKLRVSKAVEFQREKQSGYTRLKIFEARQNPHLSLYMVHPTKSASVGLPQVHPIANYDILMEPEIVDAEILISRLLSTGESKGYNGRYLI